MPTVAEQLRLAREDQKLNIYQVAEITKIKTDHIRALESGQYDTFSAPVYIRGFVRTYARVLKLDESRVVADLEAELNRTTKFREPPPLTAKPRGALDFVMLQLTRMNWRVAAVLGAVAAAGIATWIGVHSWRARNEADPLRHLGPGVYQSRPDQSGEFLPLPTNATRKP